jgi:hypothetical protein
MLLQLVTRSLEHDLTFDENQISTGDCRNRREILVDNNRVR